MRIREEGGAVEDKGRDRRNFKKKKNEKDNVKG
jgi:hypothetical protein